MTPRTARDISVYSIAAGVATIFVGICMGFQPGWANLEPLGIEGPGLFHGFVALVTFISIFSLEAALLAQMATIIPRWFTWHGNGWTLFVILLIPAAVFAIWATSELFPLLLR